MAGPGFGDLRLAESADPGQEVDRKIQRVLELLPKLKDPARRAKAEAFLRENGVAAPRGITISTPEGDTSVGPGGAVQDSGDAHVGVTLAEAAERFSGSYDAATLERLRSGDIGALRTLRPADQADVERRLGERRAAAAAPASHAPMGERPGDLAGELDARAYERAPVSRTRGGPPRMEPTHTLTERVAAGVAQPASGAMRGLSAATGHLATLPARAIAPEGQKLVDELADSSAVSTPTSIASNMLPMSLGSRVAGYAARMLPEVAAGGGLLRAGLRGAVGAGRAAAGGAAAGAADAGGAALNDVQRGAPASAVPDAMVEGALNAVPASLAMYPFFAGMQRLGRTAVDDLRRSPDLGPDVLALENVGLGTRLPLLNRDISLRAVQSEAPAPTRPGVLPFTRVKGPEPEGNAIGAAQREQQLTGRPAGTITGERAGKKVLSSLGDERGEMRARHADENEQMSQNLRDYRVKTEPIAAHLMDLVSKGKFDDFSALPGKAADNSALQRELESVVTVRWAKPGEQGLPPDAVARLGFKLPAAAEPAPRGPGDTIPPPGRKGRARKEAGIVIEPKELSADQLEVSIRKFDELADEARNVKKGESGKAAQSIAAVMRQMRNDFRTNDGHHVVYSRSGADRVVEPDNTVSSSYARTKREHGQEMTGFEDKLRELGLSDRLDDIRPEDANQLRAVVGKIMGGDPALQKLFPNDPVAQRELRIAAAHQAFDSLYGQAAAGKPNVIAGPSGPHGILSLGGSARLAFDPIARGLAGTGLSEGAQRGLSGSRSGRIAPQVPPETVNRFLAMIGLGGTEEDL